MALTFLQLVNDVNQRVNETELTSSNFLTSQGHYKNTRQAVNSAIAFINQDQFEWPFNHVTYNETLTAGTNRYDYQADAKSVDFESFRIRRDDTFGNETRWLKNISYEEYLQNHLDDEYNSDTSIRDLPRYVFSTPDSGYGVWPVPDEAYELDYEYYSATSDLVSATDTTNLPDMWRHIIVDGAVYYTYLFREDIENADRVFDKFDGGISNMRTLYINRNEDMRDTRIQRNTRAGRFLGVD